MADKTLRSITFPGLPDRYVIPEQVSIDATLSQQGKAADAKAVGDALKAQIAPAYSTSGTYAVGDLVLYNNALYRCKTAITTAEAWTPAHWEATTINDVARKVTDLESASMELDASKAPVIIQEASGSVASFSDGADGLPMKSLVAAIEPVQDLHGYDHPWPGGASKNKLDLTRAAGTYTFTGVTFVINDDGTIKCNGTNTGSEILFNFTDIIPNNFNGDILSGAVSSNLGIACTFYQTSTGTFVSSRVDGGNGATLDSDAPYCRFAVRVPAGSTVNGTVKPMVRLASESDATFVPYKNICPITGWTGLSGKRTGKNLWNYPTPIHVSYNGVSWDISGSTIVAQGTATVDVAPIAGIYSASYENANIGPFPPGNYTIQLLGYSGSNAGTRLTCAAFKRDGTNLLNNVRLESGTPRSIQADQPVKFGIWCNVASGDTVDFAATISLVADSDVSYEPYQGDTISVNWQSQAGTVYGGTVDLISGKLVVDRAGVTIEASDNLSVTGVTQLSSTITRIEGVARTPAFPYGDAYVLGNTNGNYSHGPYVEAWSSLVIHGYSAGSTLALYIPASANVTDATTAIAWLKAQATAGTPIQMAYPLATPIEYQLTPQEVTTLLGNNVVYTDVGPVSVTAPRDTKMYVDNKIAEAVAAALNA